MSITYPQIDDHAELLNAALDIMAAAQEFVDRTGPDRSAFFHILTEWADWQAVATLTPNCADSQRLYDAALAILCCWAGIDDTAGFRRYLANFMRQGGAA